MHDCRKDLEALFYLHDIHAEAVWDVQASSWAAQRTQRSRLAWRIGQLAARCWDCMVQSAARQ